MSKWIAASTVALSLLLTGCVTSYEELAENERMNDLIDYRVHQCHLHSHTHPHAGCDCGYSQGRP